MDTLFGKQVILKIYYYILWFKLYSRFPEMLLWHHKLPSVEFTHARVIVIRCGMDASILSLPIAFLCRYFFEKDTVSLIYVGLLLIILFYECFLSPNRQVGSEVKIFQAREIWFPKWILELTTNKFIFVLIEIIGVILQFLIMVMSIVVLALLHR